MMTLTQVIDAATVALGLMSWWACACRIGAMHISTHRLSAILWHAVTACLALWVVEQAIVHPGDPLALATACSLWALMHATLPDWLDGPPAWTWLAEPAGAQT